MKLSCNEIYYGSNQKSALTGNDGFGVRTFTIGMEPALINAVARSLPGYQVNPERQLCLEDIKANPRVVYDYPPVYTFSSVTADDGSSVWVASRTVYIASDYGFFLDGDVYARVGSNYFTHALITRELPTPELLTAMTRDGFFMPHDYTMSRDNTELATLITGDPVLLPAREINLPDILPSIDPKYAAIVPALLQAAVNRATGKTAELTKIIIKAPADRVKNVIDILGAMPPEMMPHIRFMTNFMKGYGVPDDLDIIVVNEHNYLPLYEDNYITVDIINGKNTNIEENPFFIHAAEAFSRGDLERGRAIVSFFINIDHHYTPDYLFLYNIFLATYTSDPLDIHNIDHRFIPRLKTASLPAKDRMTINRKINDAINQTLVYSENPDDITLSIHIITDLQEKLPGILTLTAAARTRVTKLVMGVQSYAQFLINELTIDTILSIISRDDVACDENFFNAVKQIDNEDIWLKLIDFYFGAGTKPHADAIISAILDSRLTPVTREHIITKLFPLPENYNILLDYLKAYPGRIPSLPVSVSNIASGSRQEIFTSLINASTDDPAVISTLAPIIRLFYQERISQSPVRGAKETLNFVNGLKQSTRSKLNPLDDMFNSFMHEMINNPTPEMKAVLEAILLFPEVFSEYFIKRSSDFLALFNNTVPQYVDQVIMITSDNLKVSDELFNGLYERWLDCGGTFAEFQPYAKGCYPINNNRIKSIVWITWKKFINNPRERDYRVNAIMDYLNWPTEERKKLAAEVPDKELAKFLTDGIKLTAQFMRKFRNIFK